MNTSLSEAEVIEDLATEYQNQGYEVLIYPMQGHLPFDLDGYRPDILATKGGGGLIVEVRRYKSKSGVERLDKIRELVEGQVGWRFVVQYIGDMDISKSGPKPVTREYVENALAEIKELVETKKFQSAFLLAWAVFEAQARRIDTNAFRRPQTPGRLITVLTEIGQISNEQAKDLRSLSAKRNTLIHGDLSLEVTELDLKKILTILTMLDRNWAPSD